MKIKEFDIKGVFEIELEPHRDHRGFFMRTYEESIFEKYNLNKNWPQENHSFNKEKNTIRGLHFQFSPHAETKIVRSTEGEIYFVFVDLRKDSETFGNWGAITLLENKNMLYLPEGFATGFCTLTDNCNLLYKMGTNYAPESQGEIKWDDLDIGIRWPIDNPILSERDKNAMTFKDFKKQYEDLEMIGKTKKIFITGAKGFVGQELVKQCKNSGMEVIAVDVVEGSEDNYHKADITSKEIADLIPEDVDAIIHLAALSRDPDCRDKGYDCFNINVLGTLNLIEAAQKKKAKQFIFASSEWVYDSFKENEIKTEESFIDMQKHKSEYAFSKLVTESNLRQKYSHGFCPITILRFGIIYGSRKNNWSAVEAIFNNVKTKEETEVGSLETGRCFIHVSDICSAIIKSIGLQGFNILNIQGNKLVTLNDIIQTSKGILNKDLQIKEKDKDNPSIKIVSNEKAKKILNWEPKIDLKEGLKNLNSFLSKEDKKCILCNSHESDILFQYSGPDQYELAVGVNKEDYSRKWVKCKKCGFCYSSYSRDKTILDKIYSSTYRNSDSSWRKNSNEEVFERIINLPEKESENKFRTKWVKENIKKMQQDNLLEEKDSYRFLDIGGGNGLFAYEFKDNFWIPHIIDPDKNNDFIKSKLNMNLIQEYYKPNSFNFKFDFISLIYVLEHIKDPVSMLNNLHKDMNSSSLLFIEVPDAISFKNKPKQDDIFNSCHLWMFNPYTLNILLDKCNFEVLSLNKIKAKRGHSALMVLAKRK